MSTDETIMALRAELDRARAKFPKNDHLFAALGEEVGELARELLECGTRERIRAEAIQVACVALRIADEGDGDFPRSMPGKEPEERCAFLGCNQSRKSILHAARSPFHGEACWYCRDGSRDSIGCHDFVPPAKPEPEKPVARYASGDEPMVGDVVETVFADVRWTVHRIGTYQGDVVVFAHSATYREVFYPGQLGLIRRAEATK